MRRRKQRVLGHSFVFKYKVPSPGPQDGEVKFEEHSILFTRHNIGRRRAR
jgi:hypothetical protein